MSIITERRLQKVLEVIKKVTDSLATKRDTVLTTSLSRGRKDDTSTGGGSFAFGMEVEASGVYSQAVGGGTIASSLYQHAFGKYNVEDEVANPIYQGDYVEIVGNGTASDRSNARSLDWSGNERLAGSVYVNCNYDSTGGNRLLDESEIMAEHDLHVIMNTIWDFPYISSWTPEDARTTHTAVIANITDAKVGSYYKIQAVRDDEETSTVEMDEPAESTTISMVLFDGVPNSNGYKYTLTLYEVGKAEVLDVVVIPGNPYYD